MNLGLNKIEPLENQFKIKHSNNFEYSKIFCEF